MNFEKPIEAKLYWVSGITDKKIKVTTFKVEKYQYKNQNFYISRVFKESFIYYFEENGKYFVFKNLAGMNKEFLDDIVRTCDMLEEKMFFQQEAILKIFEYKLGKIGG